jgi:CDP-paratose 2-epimerase
VVKVLITGGAGFIGSNAAARHLARGNEVVVVDNLFRRGAARNLEWLRTRPGSEGPGRLTHAAVDVRDAAALGEVFRAHADAAVVLHLAGQVAVTTSVQNPREDFEINALGSFNVLEAARALHGAGTLKAYLYTSTNKVYGGMEDVGVITTEGPRGGRYAYGSPRLARGVPETQPLDFHSPYGCSKGAADQYTIDYARIYGLPAVCLRQSAIYGERQMGVEDQGWVSWFCIRAAQRKPMTIYGDGMQVRDVLWIDDLLDAYDRCVERIDAVQGQALNLGGGPANVLAIGEVPRLLERKLREAGELGPGEALDVRYDDWRPGDQRVFIADIGKAERALGWHPTVGPDEGVDRLFAWVRDNLDLFDDL